MNKQGGFIGWIFVFIIAIIILGYYGFDIRKAVEAPTTQSNLTYVQQIVSNIWHNFLKKPWDFFWQNIIHRFILDPFFKGLTPRPATTFESYPQRALGLYSFG